MSQLVTRKRPNWLYTKKKCLLREKKSQSENKRVPFSLKSASFQMYLSAKTNSLEKLLKIWTVRAGKFLNRY